MNIKHIVTDNSFDLKSVEYLDGSVGNNPYYLQLGGNNWGKVGTIVTFAELSKGRENQSYFASGEIYISIVGLIFRLMDIPMFDLGRLLQIHELLNEEDLKLLIIHTNNAINRSMNKDEKITNERNGRKLKERIKEFLDIIETEPQQPKTELSKIWLNEPKITVDNFLKLGIEKGIWNEQNNIITAKGKLYGTGKSLLGNLSIALKGYAISENTDYKEVGKAFCNTFNLPINEKTKEKFKAFSSGNEKQIILLKKAFNIK